MLQTAPCDFILYQMSKAEILEQLPKLRPEERREILERIWDLEERELLAGRGPTADEKALLDSELREYEQDPQAGVTWDEVESRLRNQSGR